MCADASHHHDAVATYQRALAIDPHNRAAKKGCARRPSSRLGTGKRRSSLEEASLGSRDAAKAEALRKPAALELEVRGSKRGSVVV